MAQLEINDDPEFQKKEWKLKRIGWIVIAVFVVSATLGLFGDGPLSTTELNSDEMRVKYQKFIRNGSPTQFEVTLPKTQDSDVKLWISNQLIKSNEFESFMPEPENTLTTATGLELTFRTTPGIQTYVQIALRPRTLGRIKGQMRSGEHPSLEIQQFAYP